jgi:hypothetical protein
VVASWATSFSGQRGALRSVELMERGAHMVLCVFSIGRLAEEGNACSLQGCSGLGGVDGVVE